MSRLLAWLSAVALLLVGAALFVAARALEDQPLVQRGDGLSPAAIARAKDILRRNDPRRMTPDVAREVRIAGPDLEALLNLAARRGSDGGATLQLREGGADVRYTLALPALPGIAGLGRYLNVSAQLGVSGHQLEIEQVRVGRLPLPALLFETALARYVRHAGLESEVDLLRRSIAQVAITPRDVAITYIWHPEVLDSVRALAIGPAERERLAAAHARLADITRRVATDGRSAPLAAVLGPLLHDAGNAAAAGDRAQAYRDALLVAALHLSGKNVAVLIPEAARWPRVRPLTLTLRERGDLAQHFVISAAIAAMSGEPLAQAVGLEKELADANGGSGFSFIDLAADRAGTRLGQLAMRDPARLAAALAAGLTDAALLPPIDGLPENMKAGEFQARFGGVDAPAYRAMSDEIDRRIAALALFR